MATIIVFQHSQWGGAGRLGLTLRDHGFTLDVRRLDADGERAIPRDYDNVHGVVSLGGPQNVGDADPWIAKEMAYLRGAHERGLAVVGICLGHQLIAKALGGEVAPMAKPELGFGRVSLGVPGQTDTMLAGVPWDFVAFQSHGQEVTRLPSGAAGLASSGPCKCQIFRAGLRTYGFQFHFEVDRPMLSTFVGQAGDWARGLGTSVGDLEKQADREYGRFAVIADRLCGNIATYCFPSVGLVGV